MTGQISSNIGRFINKARLERAITQERLCSGLCNVSTMSRIERGLLTPSVSLLNALMERLGYYSSKENNDLWALASTWLDQKKKALSIAIKQHDIAQSEMIFAEIEGHSELSSGMGLQLLLLSKTVLALMKGGNGEVIDADACLKDIRRAISLTINDFDEDLVRNYMMTKNEISCVNTLGGLYNYMGDREKTLSVLKALKDNMDAFCVDKHELQEQYSTNLYNTALLLHNLRRHEEAAKACEECRLFGIDYGDYSRFPFLLLIYAESLSAVGKRRTAREMLLDAYHTAGAFSRPQEKELIAGAFKEIFGHKITTASIDNSIEEDIDDTTAHSFRTDRLAALLLFLGDKEMPAKELMEGLNLRHMPNFRRNYLVPALLSKQICMTIPENPKDKRQKYKAADS
jgi:transcriptional regulator with XRE-family HTH domain